jgi:hypothetical protein
MISPSIRARIEEVGKLTGFGKRNRGGKRGRVANLSIDGKQQANVDGFLGALGQPASLSLF